MNRRSVVAFSALCFSAALTLDVASAQTLSPITVTGFNMDPIQGDNPNAANNQPENFQGFTFAANGQGGVNYGLPANGTIVSAGDPNATFQLAPYTSNNVLALEGGSNGNPNGLGETNTLTLSSPTSYATVGVLLATAGTGGATFTFNFADSTSVIETVPVLPYWQSSQATETADGAINAGVLQLYNNVGVNFDEYNFTLPTADQSKILDSVTISFTVVPTDTTPGDIPNGTLGIFALSGAVPEPSTYAMLFVGLGALIFIVRRRARLNG